MQSWASVVPPLWTPSLEAHGSQEREMRRAGSARLSFSELLFSPCEGWENRLSTTLSRLQETWPTIRGWELWLPWPWKVSVLHGAFLSLESSAHLSRDNGHSGTRNWKFLSHLHSLAAKEWWRICLHSTFSPSSLGGFCPFYLSWAFVIPNWDHEWGRAGDRMGKASGLRLQRAWRVKDLEGSGTAVWIFAYMWNLKEMVQMNLFINQK